MKLRTGREQLQLAAIRRRSYTICISDTFQSTCFLIQWITTLPSIGGRSQNLCSDLQTYSKTIFTSNYTALKKCYTICRAASEITDRLLAHTHIYAHYIYVYIEGYQFMLCFFIFHRKTERVCVHVHMYIIVYCLIVYSFIWKQ